MNKPVINRQILVTALVAVCGSATLALPAFAQTAPNDTHSQQTTATTPNQKLSASGKRDPQHAVPAPGSRNCLRDTGSHIPPAKGQCLPVIGTSYSHQDIQRTGQTNLGQALQMLDPSVTVHGH